MDARDPLAGTPAGRGDMAEAGPGTSWHAHLPKVLLVLGLMGLWEVAVRFLKWEFFARAALEHHVHCLACWMLEALFPYLLWGILAALPVWASWRWRLDRAPRTCMAAGHVAALALHAVAFQGLYYALYGLVQDKVPVPAFVGALCLGFRTVTVEKVLYWSWNCAVNYAFLALAAHVLDFHAEARERAVAASRAEARLVEARLQTLQSQVQPHFLFNALANIHALVSVDDVAAKRMVNLLSDFL
ncbi:histidine kinase, partial [bacterium]|nr:histidine kinase [bacterium]